jgi:hypothetical protein
MRIKHKVRPRIAADTAMKNLLFGPDDDLSEVVIDQYDQQTSGTIKVLQSANEDVPLGDIDTVKGFYIQVDGDCTLKINGSSDGIDLVKSTTANVLYAKFFIEADITQINITAPSDADVIATYCAWGIAT